jgi:hypothetical protein
MLNSLTSMFTSTTEDSLTYLGEYEAMAGEIKSIVSEEDMAKYLNDSIDELGAKSSETLTEVESLG